MDSKEKKKRSPSPPRDRYYPSPYGSEPPGAFPPAPQSVPGLPPPPAAGVGNDSNYVNGGNGNVPASPYRPYDSAPALPLQQKPSPLPGPPPPPQSLPPQQQQSYLPQMPPPSMTEIPPQPTMSTAGSVVGSGGRPGAGTAADYYAGPNPPPGPPTLPQSPGPMYPSGNNTTMTKADLRAARSSAEAGLERLISLQRQQRQHLQYGPGAAGVPGSTAAAVQEQVRQQTGAVLRDLRQVRRAVAALAKAAQNHRFRRWIVGGILATFIPLVRRLFRRPLNRAAAAGNDGGSSGQIMAANDTEYAFARSRTLVDRMLGAVHRRGGLASLAFFVFAVLYVFSNEVSLRVARTVGRRLKRLSSKVERGDEALDEADVRLLAGWRWRVLLWGRQ